MDRIEKYREIKERLLKKESNYTLYFQFPFRFHNIILEILENELENESENE